MNLCLNSSVERMHLGDGAQGKNEGRLQFFNHCQLAFLSPDRGFRANLETGRERRNTKLREVVDCVENQMRVGWREMLNPIWKLYYT